MISTATWFYFGAGTVLFFFWIYGIYAFARDCRRTYIPGLRGWVAIRREADDESQEEENPEERIRQLY